MMAINLMLIITIVIVMIKMIDPAALADIQQCFKSHGTKAGEMLLLGSELQYHGGNEHFCG